MKKEEEDEEGEEGEEEGKMARRRKNKIKGDYFASHPPPPFIPCAQNFTGCQQRAEFLLRQLVARLAHDDALALLGHGHIIVVRVCRINSRLLPQTKRKKKDDGNDDDDNYNNNKRGEKTV